MIESSLSSILNITPMLTVARLAHLMTTRLFRNRFYDRNASATSARGKKGAAMKISDAKRDLKAKYGLKQQEVISNLNYLIDRGWVKRYEVQKTVSVSGGTIPSTVTWYEVSALGIDRIEGGSEYEPKDRYPGINVNATGTNVITLGDGNVVNAKFSELRDQLDNLKSEIASSSALTDKQKLDVTVDIESVKDQLAKETPDTTIVKHLWAGIDRVAKVAGLVEAVHKILPYIEHLM
jgi:hypothetical protein